MKPPAPVSTPCPLKVDMPPPLVSVVRVIFHYFRFVSEDAIIVACASAAPGVFKTFLIDFTNYFSVDSAFCLRATDF